MPTGAKRFGQTTKRGGRGRTFRKVKTRPSACKRGYGRRWQRASKAFLRLPENMFCARCSTAEQLVVATLVDHVKPHQGDQELFWDRKNWQGLCARCHSIKTASEDGGFGNQKRI